MTHTTTPSFWAAFAKLPTNVREAARQNYKLLTADPQHPALRFKKVGSSWSVRIGRQYRALAMQHGSTYVWFWIGLHDLYERKL